MDGPCTSSQSWADDVKSYRSSFGTGSLATPTSEHLAAVRYTRSVPSLQPVGEPKHPMFGALAEPVHRPNTNDGSAQRSKWHGWGHNDLLSHPEPVAAERQAPRAGTSPCRGGMWGVMAMAPEPGRLDSWVGNPCISPGKGKKPTQPAPDPKGRQGLFDVLAMRGKPGNMADDGWVGNQQCDPAKGKAKAASPEALRGRADLFAVMHQDVLRQARQGGGSKPDGKDPLADAWVGNMSIEPAKGKKPVTVISAALLDHLHGPLPKEGPAGDTPAPPQGKKMKLEGASTARRSEVKEIFRSFAEPPPKPADAQQGGGTRAGGTSNSMYALMTFRPLDSSEQQHYKKTFYTGGKAQGRRYIPLQLASEEPIYPLNARGRTAAMEQLQLETLARSRRVSGDAAAGRRAGSRASQKSVK